MIKARFVVDALDDGYVIRSTTGEMVPGPEGPVGLQYDKACPLLSDVAEALSVWHVEVSRQSGGLLAPGPNKPTIPQG